VSALRAAMLRTLVARLNRIEPDSDKAHLVYAEAAAAGLAEALEAEQRNLAQIDTEDAAALTRSLVMPRVRAVQ
jgi:hypothetical protein